MKKLVMILCSSILFFCQSYAQTQNGFSSVRSRNFNEDGNNIIKKIVEFTKNNNSTMKIIANTHGLIILEDSLNEAAAVKYSDCELPAKNSHILNGYEKFIIYVKPDSGKTTVEIQSLITCRIAYIKVDLKFPGQVEKSIECNSNGKREDEILDYISGKSNL